MCVAGGSKEERRNVRKLVERYDGLFLDDPFVDLDTCSHMLVWKAEGNFLTTKLYHCTSNCIGEQFDAAVINLHCTSKLTIQQCETRHAAARANVQRAEYL